jgi:hypothetical protein
MANATFVYVISGDHGRQKIGVSDDPKQRVRDLQTGSPFPLKLEFVGLTEGTGYDVEGEAHFMLHSHRQSGEWFTVPPEVAITAVMAAARRLGHSIKPVDPDNIPNVGWPGPMPSGRQPPKWILPTIGLAVVLPVMIPIVVAFDRGNIGAISFIVLTGLLLLAIKVLAKGVKQVAGLFGYYAP